MGHVKLDAPVGGELELIPGEWLGFPYAIRVAEERGASRIHIQPRLTDPTVAGDIRPDVYGERPGQVPIIVEIEYSSGEKFKVDGVRHRESKLVGKAEFVFILLPGATGCRKRLREWFGPSVEFLDWTDLVERHGAVGIATGAQAAA